MLQSFLEEAGAWSQGAGAGYKEQEQKNSCHNHIRLCADVHEPTCHSMVYHHGLDHRRRYHRPGIAHHNPGIWAPGTVRPSGESQN